jgi:hypothetical protein
MRPAIISSSRRVYCFAALGATLILVSSICAAAQQAEIEFTATRIDRAARLSDAGSGLITANVVVNSPDD